MADNTQSEVDIINQEISQLKGILNRQNNDEFKSLTAAEPTQGDFCHQSTATCSLNTTTDTSVVELSEKIDDEEKVSQENIFSAVDVDEGELVVDEEEEAGGLEECLKFNQNYQVLIKQQLLKVQHALAQNRERQAEIKDDYNIAYISKKRPKRERSLLSFCQSYFKGDLGQGPPPSEETSRRHAGKEPSAHIIPALKWQKPQLERLTAGVQSDGMEQKMQPILNRREVLMRKLKSLKNDEEEEKDELKKTIQEIDDELDRIKNMPDREQIGDRLRQVDFTKISIMDLEGTRSAFECQVQWQNYQHPDINKTDWSSQEIQSLANAVNTYGEYDWDTVAEEIGGGRLPWQCLDAYQREIPQESDNVKFTEEEDALLLKLVDSFRIGDFIPFQKVAFFMNRLRRQVVARWNTRLDPNLKLGPWTAAEDQLLKEGIEQFGNSWMKIADRIKGRHPVSIRERWLTSLNPQRKSGKWSIEEDIALLEMRLEYGKGNWRLMTEQLAKRTNSKHERAMNGLVIRQRLLEVQINRFKNKIEENAEEDEVKVEIKEEDGSLSKEMCEWMRKYINHLKKKLVGKKQIMQLIEQNKWDQVPNANKLREWFRRSEIEQICKDRNKDGKPHVLRKRRPKKRKYSITESENSSQSEDEDEDEEDDFEDEEEKDEGEQPSKPKTSRKVGRPKGTLMDTIVAAQIKHLLKQYAGFVTRDRQMKISKAQETLSKIPELKVKQSSLSVYIALLKVFQVDMNTTASYIRHITNRRKALTLSDKDSPKKCVSDTGNQEIPDTAIAAPVISLAGVQARSPQFSLNTHLSTAFQMGMVPATWLLPGQTIQPDGNLSQHSTQLPRFQAPMSPMSQVPMSLATQRLPTLAQTTQPAGNLSQHSTQQPRFQAPMSPMSQVPMTSATQRLPAPGQTTQPAGNLSQHSTQFPRFQAPMSLVTSNCPAVTPISRTVGCTSSSTSETSTLTSTATRLTTTASQILTKGAQPREETQAISSGSSAAISTSMNPLPATIVTSHGQGHQTNTSPLPAKSIDLSSVQLPNLPGTNLVQNILPAMNQFQPQGSQLFQTLMPNILARGLLPTNPGNILQTSGVINIPGKGFLVPVQNFCSVPQIGSTQSAVINPTTRPIAQPGTPSYVPATTSAAIPNSLNVSSPPAVTSTPVTTKNAMPIAGNATKSVNINLPYYERSLKKMSRKVTTVPDKGREFSHEMLLIASLPEVEKVSETKYIVPTRYFKLFDSGDMDLLLARKTFIADKVSDNKSGPNTIQVQTRLPETSSTKQSCSAKSTNQSVSSDYHESLVRLIFRSPKYDEDNISFACDDHGLQYFLTCIKGNNDSRKCSWVKIDVRPITIADHGKINALVYKPGTLRKKPFTVVIPDLGKYNIYEDVSSVMVNSPTTCSMLQKQRQKQQKLLPYLSPNPERISDFLANHDRPGAQRKRPRPELVVSQSQIFSSDELSKANSLIFRILGNNPSSMQLLPPNLANVKALKSLRSHRKELINQTKGCIIPKHIHHRLKDANANVLGSTSAETETTDSECDSQNVKDALHVIRKTPEYKQFNARFRSLFAWPTMLSKIEKTG